MGNNLNEIIWADVIGYEGIYMVNNFGEIKILPYQIPYINGRTRIKKERIKNTTINRGYVKVQLSKNGVNKTHNVHKLVLEAFIGLCPIGKNQVNHKNGIKHDNRVENLEWSNNSDNIKHSFHVLKRELPPMAFKKGKDHVYYGKGHLKKSCKKIYCTTLNIEFISIAEAAKKLGLNRGNIGSVLHDRYIHTGGLSFRYI